MTRSFFITLAALFLTLQSSFALRGGPFDNNAPGGRTSGVYQAIYTFANGNGIVRFSDDTSADVTSRSDVVIFYRGVIYVGNAFCATDYANNKVHCSTTASSRNGTSINIGTVTSNFTAKIKSTGAITRFSGRGKLHFFASVSVTQPGPTGDFGTVQSMRVNGTRISVLITGGNSSGNTGTGTGGTGGTTGVTIN